MKNEHDALIERLQDSVAAYAQAKGLPFWATAAAVVIRTEIKRTNDAIQTDEIVKIIMQFFDDV